MILAAGAAAVSSCTPKSEFAPLASSVTVDKADVVLAATSATAKVTVTADGDWISVAPSWAAVSPKSGNAGTTEVTITAKDNVNEWKEEMGPRKEALYFFGDGEEAGMAQVNLLQNGEPGLNSERTYKKISSADDLEAGKAYLMVYKSNDAGDLVASKPLSLTADDGSYSYMYADAVTESEEGTIVLPNGSKGFVFEAKGSGFAIQQSDGNYLYQASTYANFYIGSTLEKADVWKAEFQEDGTVKLINRTNGGEESDANDKVMHWSSSYSNIEARSGGAAPYPYLYKDSAAPTDEVLVVEDVTVVASATTATINVNANKTWKVRNHDEWIKSFAKSEDGKSVVVTFDANTSTEAARTAEFTIIGETTNKVVTLTQNKIATTIAELLAQVTSTNQNDASPFEATLLTPAVVSYVNGSNVYIEDASGAIKYYKSGHGLTAGTTLSGKVSGKAYIRNGVPQISVLDEGYTKGEGGTIPETEMTIADLLKNYDANLSRRIVLKGVTVTDGIGSGDRNGKIAKDGKDIALYDESKAVVIAKNAIGNLIAYPSKYNASKQLSVWASSDFTKTGEVTGIQIDGDFSDWTDITTGIKAESETAHYKELKVTYDETYFYFYTKMSTENTAMWANGRYCYFNFDLDNNPATGFTHDNVAGLEAYVYFFMFGGTAEAPAINSTPAGKVALIDANNPTADPATSDFTCEANACAGKIGTGVVETEVKVARSAVGAKKGDVINVSSWANKSASELKNKVVNITLEK